MTLSVLGRAMLLAGCTAAGFYLAGRSGRRRKELLLAASFLGEVCSRLAFCLQPAGELIEELGREAAFRSLPCLQLFLQRGEIFPKGWRAAVMDCGMGLSNIVSRVHSINGHCNVEGAKGKGMHAAIRVNVRGEASAAAGARRRTAARRRKRR